MERKRSDVRLAPKPKKQRPAGAAVFQPRVTQALFRALAVEWARHGYGALSLEAVAKRAGVGKAALYRRWRSKLEMVGDSLEQLGLQMHPAPDTGSFAGDLEVLLFTFREQLRHRFVGRILADLHAEMNRNPQLAKRVREVIQKKRRERGEIILRRAIARGEISADTDLELVKDATGALVYWRLVVLGEAADDQYIRRVLHAILAIALQCKKGH
jgi:AcrR family transcriptional regulator